TCAWGPRGRSGRRPGRRARALGGERARVTPPLPMAWNDWRYRLARLRGREVARLRPAYSQLADGEPRRLVLAPFTPRDIEVADSDLTGAGPVPPRPGNGHADGPRGHGPPAGRTG